jgi:hypothetical protein
MHASSKRFNTIKAITLALVIAFIIFTTLGGSPDMLIAFF